MAAPIGIAPTGINPVAHAAKAGRMRHGVPDGKVEPRGWDGIAVERGPAFRKVLAWLGEP